MLKIVISLIITVILFFLGQIASILSKVINIIYTSLIQLKRWIFKKRNKQIKNAKQLKEIFKVKKVKLSIEKKYKSSYNVISIILMLLSIILLIINSSPLKLWEINIISNYLFKVLFFIGYIISLQTFQSIILTLLITTLSFSLSSIWLTWKEMAPIRKQKEIDKAKFIVSRELTTKEILEIIEEKEEQLEIENL